MVQMTVLYVGPASLINLGFKRPSENDMYPGSSHPQKQHSLARINILLWLINLPCKNMSPMRRTMLMYMYHVLVCEHADNVDVNIPCIPCSGL